MHKQKNDWYYIKNIAHNQTFFNASFHQIVKKIKHLIFNSFPRERESDCKELQSQIDNLTKQSAEEREQLRQQLQDEKLEREKETKALREFFG